MSEAIPKVPSQADGLTGLGKLPTRGLDMRNPVQYELSALEELRVDVEKAPIIHIWMSKGQAEISGSELSTDRIYSFLRGTKFSIWSWTGCTIMVEGKPDSIYKSKESRVVTMQFNFHNTLEQYRSLAAKNDHTPNRENALPRDTWGPRVLLVGAPASGRSCLARVLLNYAARMRGEDRRNPIFVDLDFLQPDLAVPGTLACCQIDRPADPMFDYYYHRKFVLPYGYTDFDSNPELLHAQIRRLGDVIEKKFENDHRAKHSGVIINSFPWSKSHGYGHILVMAKAFKVTVIAVMDNERMFAELQNLPQAAREAGQEENLEKSLQIVSIPRSRSTWDTAQEERRIHRDARIRYNIYGHPLRSPRHMPFEHEVDFGDMILCKLGNPAITKALLPENADLVKVKTTAYLIQIKDLNYLLNHILYITNVDVPEKVITEGSVIGYLLVKAINTAAKKVTFLTNFEVLPKKVFLTSTISLREQQ